MLLASAAMADNAFAATVTWETVNNNGDFPGRTTETFFSYNQPRSVATAWSFSVPPGGRRAAAALRLGEFYSRAMSAPGQQIERVADNKTTLVPDPNNTGAGFEEFLASTRTGRWRSAGSRSPSGPTPTRAVRTNAPGRRAYTPTRADPSWRGEPTRRRAELRGLQCAGISDRGNEVRPVPGRSLADRIGRGVQGQLDGCERRPDGHLLSATCWLTAVPRQSGSSRSPAWRSRTRAGHRAAVPSSDQPRRRAREGTGPSSPSATRTRLPQGASTSPACRTIRTSRHSSTSARVCRAAAERPSTASARRCPSTGARLRSGARGGRTRRQYAGLRQRGQCGGGRVLPEQSDKDAVTGLPTGMTTREVPVHQGISTVDAKTGEVAMVAQTGDDGVDDLLFWNSRGVRRANRAAVREKISSPRAGARARSSRPTATGRSSRRPTTLWTACTST